VAELNSVPLLVVEVTSPSTRDHDLGIKVELYRRCKVPFYAIIDHHAGEDGDGSALWGYRLIGDEYQRVEPGADGRLWLEVVRQWLSIEEQEAVLYDEQGRRLLRAEELHQRLIEIRRLDATFATLEEMGREAKRLTEESVEAWRLAEENSTAAAQAWGIAVKKSSDAEVSRRAAAEKSTAAEQARQAHAALVQTWREGWPRLKGA
jgi:hypothetical protein